MVLLCISVRLWCLSQPPCFAKLWYYYCRRQSSHKGLKRVLFVCLLETYLGVHSPILFLICSLALGNECPGVFSSPSVKVVQTQVLIQYKKEEDDAKSEWAISILAHMRKLCTFTFSRHFGFLPWWVAYSQCSSFLKINTLINNLIVI